MITLITCVQCVNVLNSKLWYIKLWSSLCHSGIPIHHGYINPHKSQITMNMDGIVQSPVAKTTCS